MSSEGYDFGEDHDVIEGGIEEGILQWFSSRDCETSDGDGTTVGWHIEVGRWPYLDKACAKANLPQVKVEQAKVNTYWQIGNKTGASLFVLAKGCYSEAEMNDKMKRAGIAFGWYKETDKNGNVKNIKVLKFRALVAELLPFFDESNPPRPVIVVAKKQFASDLLSILGRDGQYRVLKANNELFQEKHGKATKTPYWGFSLFLVPGKREKRMNKDKTVGSPVSPIVGEIPATINAEYLEAHHVGEYLALVKSEIEDSVAWSLQASQDIYAGANGDTEEAEPSMESYDHPFDDGLGEYDAEFAANASAPKPPAKTAPSNNLKPLSSEQLAKITGTAAPQQREVLQRLKQLATAQKAGLSREEAGKAILAAQKKH